MTLTSFAKKKKKKIILKYEKYNNIMRLLILKQNVQLLPNYEYNIIKYIKHLLIINLREIAIELTIMKYFTKRPSPQYKYKYM